MLQVVAIMSVMVDSQILPATNGYTNGDVDMDAGAREGALRFSSGLILPPPEIKCKHLHFYRSLHTLQNIPSSNTAVIDRTALFVARSANPPQFEDKIREGQRSDPKFSFLNPADPYHAYYRDRMDKIMQGDLGDESAVKEGQREAEGTIEELTAAVDVGVEPPPPEFIMDLPNISSIDL